MNKIPILVCSATLIVSCGASSTPVNAQEQPPWIESNEWNSLSTSQKQEARVQELRGRVYSYLADRDYQFGQGAGHDIERAIQRAAAEIQMERPDLRRTRMEQAVVNFRLVIDTMIIESHQIPGYQQSHHRMIGEQTFASAMSKLCPLWPFCD